MIETLTDLTCTFFRLMSFADRLGWSHVAEFGRRSIDLRYPQSHEPF